MYRYDSVTDLIKIPRQNIDLNETYPVMQGERREPFPREHFKKPVKRGEKISLFCGNF